MVEAVSIKSTENNPTLEEQAAAQDAAAAAKVKATAKLAGEVDAPERPEWLPEKFKTAEDMAAAYKELEAGKSAPKPEEKPKDEAKEIEEAGKAVEKAGLDMEALSTEWETDGKLSEANYKALEAVGISPEMVEMYAKGIESQRAATEAEMLAPVGGNIETYTEMVTWASNELSDAEIDSFNAVLETGNTPAIKLAVAELAAKFNTANGVDPTGDLQGRVSTSGNSRYESTADLMKDMQNPEYAKNPAFRAKVEAKLGRSNIM
jgi:hypothetical protein